MKLFVLLSLAFLAASLSALNFEAEELSFSLEKGFWEMDGLFYFANYTAEPVSKVIFFPVPQDSLNLAPELISLGLSLADSLASCTLLNQFEEGFTFSLSMPEQHFCAVRIVYRQKLLGNTAKYIISSANTWGKPLRFASYSLRLGKGLELSKLPFANPVHKEGLLYWEFRDFRPETEFELQFRR